MQELIFKNTKVLCIDVINTLIKKVNIHDQESFQTLQVMSQREDF